jgi:hypothetical protein
MQAPAIWQVVVTDGSQHTPACGPGRDRIGRRIGVADAQIAAVCRDMGAILATRNTAGFEETGIELINSWKPG